MKLVSPGHSEVILEIESAGRTVRVLFDAWLSDYAFGDFMQRNPRVDIASLPEIDAVYISHAHCDHFDPYTLTALFQKKRLLVLPETIAFLKPLLSSFLPLAEIQILRHKRTERLLGLQWTAFAFPSHYITNEDDVMPLVIRSETESVFFEADVALPDIPEAHKAVDQAMGRTARVFVSTRNELEALYASYDASSPQARKQALAAYRRKRKDELAWEYERYAELDLPCPMEPGSIKLLTGQGMVYPEIINAGLLKLSRPFPLADVLSIEKAAAKEAGLSLEMYVLSPGEIFDTRTKTTGRSSLKIEPAAVAFEPETPAPAPRPEGPLLSAVRDPAAQKKKILAILNERFVPHTVYHREEPLKLLLLARGFYCIRVLYGNAQSYESVDYRIDYASVKFAPAEACEKPDEIYWANDLEDFLEGRQDQFSTTMHRFFPDTSIRLWTMLGLPFLNNDLIENKLRFHFDRALAGKTPLEWIQEACGHSVRSS